MQALIRTGKAAQQGISTMPLPKKEQPNPLDEETPQDLERQKQAFLKKLMEINRKQAGEKKKETLNSDDEQA